MQHLGTVDFCYLDDISGMKVFFVATKVSLKPSQHGRQEISHFF